jgi:2,4-dienoyl-CoA reductase-like NADH-dependent reductase (Old Yellow Enzyme family)
MQSGRSSFQCEVTTKLINFYARRSTATGLPIVEHAFVEHMGKIGPKQLGIYSDTLISGFEELADAIHAAGAPAIVQISHAGGVANEKVIGAKPAGPSDRGKTRMLQIEELYAISEAFVAATERALKAGFDGVEIHGAHGYLLNQFFSPLLNKREDEFGGSLENRMAFPLLVTQKVRKTLGNKLLLYRLGADDLSPKGNQVQEAIVFAQKLEAAGVDILDVSGGMCGSNPKQLQHIQGYFIPQAEAVKAETHVPIIGVGSITQPEFADNLVQSGKVDLVAIGRSLLHDNEWAEKALQTLGA